MRRRIGFALVVVSALFGGATSGYATDVGQGETIVVSPPEGRVGQRFNFTCTNFPEPTRYDVVYVAAAGTPDVDPYTPEGYQEKILWKDYAINCYRNNGRFISLINFPPYFAPGTYEVRFLTRLYNNENRGEIATRTVFTVH